MAKIREMKKGSNEKTVKELYEDFQLFHSEKILGCFLLQLTGCASVLSRNAFLFCVYV